MKRRCILLLCIIFVTAVPTVTSEPLDSDQNHGILVSGTVTSGDPVAGAEVRVLNTELVATTDAGGRFSILIPSEGTFVFVVRAAGYRISAREVSVPSKSPLVFELAAVAVDLDTVHIVGDLEEPPAGGDVISDAEISQIPNAGDPFGVVEQIPGVIGYGSIIDPGYAPTGFGLGFSRASRGVSMFGGDMDFNSYYYDHIQIPDNQHAETGAPIVSEAIVSSMEIQKGISGFESGARIGGLFRAIPDTRFSESELLFNPGTDALSLVWRKKLSDDARFIIGASKSLTEIYMPLLFWGYGELFTALNFPFIESGLVMVPSYADLCSSFVYSLDRRDLSASLIGYYDAQTLRIDMLGDYDGETSTFPFFVGLGGSWTEYHSPDISQRFDVSATWYRKHGDVLIDMDIADFATGVADELGVSCEDMFAAFDDIGTSGYIYMEEKQRINVVAAEVSDALRFALPGKSWIEAGVSGRYANIYGAYEAQTDFNLIYFTLPISQSYTVPLVTYDEDVVRLFGYGKIGNDGPGITWSAGAGMTWYPFHDSYTPSILLEAAMPGLGVSGLPLDVSFRLGWSSVAYEEYVFAERRLTETFLNMESTSSFADLPQAVVFSGKAGLDLSESTRLAFDPYASWYYSLSGLALYAMYVDPYSGGAENRDLIAQTEVVDPDYGFSAGSGFSFTHDFTDQLNLRISYVLSFTRYHSRSGLYWFASNNDVRHTLRSILFHEDSAGRSFAVNLDLYADKPFTPETVVSADAGTLEKERLNSARDYVPRFALGFRYEQPSRKFKRDGYFQINCKNILSFINPELVGMKDSSRTIVGASTADFKHRHYELLRTDLFHIMSTIGFEIEAKYSF